MKWMIYGATGYTGLAIAKEAKKRNLQPILAGRSKNKIESLAKELGFDSRVFSLSQQNEIESNLEDIATVLHCAGPFVNTSQPMVDACLKTQTNYLDITGEIPVFETLQLQSQVAKEANIMLLPGVGFDVVPTDCLAAMLHADLPTATHLELAFMGIGNRSKGTIKSSLGAFPDGSKIRKDGEIISSPFFSISRDIVLRKKPQKMYSIPWGDVSTAMFSTGIKNIIVYSAFPEDQVKAIKNFGFLFKMLKSKLILNFAQHLVDNFYKGPVEENFGKGVSYLWGEVTDGNKTVTKKMKTPEGYALTVQTALNAIELILKGKVTTGFQTPSSLFGKDFVLQVDGVSVS